MAYADFLKSFCLLFIGTSAMLMGLAACNLNRPYPHADLAPLNETPGFFVMTSDYVSSAVAVLNAQGELLTEAWIDSGTTPAGLTTTLGGDVVFSSSPDSTLTIIDRLGVDVVTRIAVPSGEVLQQIHVQSDVAGETGFRSNPQDWLLLDETAALISRLEPNRNPGVSELERGSDVLWVNPASGALIGRTDLSSLAGEQNGVTIYARPTQLQRLGDTVAIGLARMSLDFRTAASGAIGLLDIRARELQKVALPEMANCTGIAKVPESDSDLWVLCAGDTFANSEERRVRSGLASLSLGAHAAIVKYQWRSKEQTSVLPPITGLIVLDASRVVVVASGDAAADQPDQALLINASTGATQVLFEASDSYVLGQGCYDVDQKLLLIPDATSGVLRWSLADEQTMLPLPTIDPSPLRQLPAREIRIFQQNPPR